MIRTPPKPPPSERWMCTPVDGEDHLILGWERFMRHHARRMFYPHRMAMDAEDIVVDLQESLLRAIRTYAWDPGGLPDGDFAKMVIRRRMSVLVRNSRAAYREAIYHYGMPIDDEGQQITPDMIVEDTKPLPDEQYDHEEMQVVCEALQYALRRNMPPAVFAVLHLRCVEELSATEIAELTNLRDWQQVSNKIGWAKIRAQVFLQSLGIDDWEDLSAASISEFTHEDLDQ